MKLSKTMNTNYILAIIFLIAIYDHFILNGLEKTCSEVFVDFNVINRPLPLCLKKENMTVKCVGMPSGHAQTITIVALLLYTYKLISLTTCAVLITLVSLQRVIVQKHTCGQVLAGIIIGLMYSYIYISNNLSPTCIVYILGITIVLTFTIMYKIEHHLYTPIPEWVDPTMISSIQKKRSSPLYLKFASILANSVLHGRTFMTWSALEEYLDILIAKIKKTNIKFDGVVGIKTGGAIISDYVSKKLNIPNYKIKLSRSEYNCDKKPSDTFNDIYQRNMVGNLGAYTVCEGIHTDLQGKNVILIDEMVTTGKTMNESIMYLKNDKKVNIICPMCISFSKHRFRFDYDLLHVLNGVTCVWPWGYDN
jgi:hypoxanthine phosphoribosyltransferase